MTAYKTATAAVRASKKSQGAVVIAEESARATLEKWAQVDLDGILSGSGWQVRIGHPAPLVEHQITWIWHLDSAGAPQVESSNGDFFRFADCRDLAAMRMTCRDKGCPESIADSVHQWRWL